MNGLEGMRDGRKAQGGRPYGAAAQAEANPSPTAEAEVIELFQQRIEEWRLWGKQKPAKLMQRFEWIDD